MKNEEGSVFKRRPAPAAGCVCVRTCVHVRACGHACVRACVCAGVGQGAEHLSSRQSSSLPSLRQGVTQEVGWGLGVAAFP